MFRRLSVTSLTGLSRLRARLQPCQTADPEDSILHGTAEAVPLSKAEPAIGGRIHTQRFFSLRAFRVAQAALVFTLAIVMLGAGDTSEKRFERVGHNMMCACGCGQILLECNHVGCPDSERMRHELQAQINATTPGSDNNGPGSSSFGSGGSDKQIMDWFVAKYGATGLAAPLRGGFDNVAWIMPIALFILAIGCTIAIIRIWRSRTQQRVPLKIKGMTAASTDELRERIRQETMY